MLPHQLAMPTVRSEWVCAWTLGVTGMTKTRVKGAEMTVRLVPMARWRHEQKSFRTRPQEGAGDAFAVAVACLGTTRIDG